MTRFAVVAIPPSGELHVVSYVSPGERHLAYVTADRWFEATLTLASVQHHAAVARREWRERQAKIGRAQR